MAMEDSCAVCAEMLEWVAYGPCGHREVCSTCIIRLRFICNDHHCCICKSEAQTIFVTKALGDYTKMINDFSGFPANPTEGPVGQYWYHEGSQAYFDDSDHYKMIKAMCRLSCGVCDKKNEQRQAGLKKLVEFNSVEQLKSHLFHRHKLFMCSLCLEGRKIFISEQKLYSKAQLSQHVKSGNSVIDGTESERGGFMGHPLCEFCQNPFYGDNELYQHMSTEHFTCHICQRQHPGQYEYFKDYDNLEVHFRQGHFLCEDEGCLAKKFIVFPTESEIKRHDAVEHGGRMSRSKRGTNLQIPTSFRISRGNEQGRPGRGHDTYSGPSNNQLFIAVHDGRDTGYVERFHVVSSNAQAVPSPGVSAIQTVANSFESLATTTPGPSSRYPKVVGQCSRNPVLEESSFPPLPAASSSSQGRSLEGLSANTMAARLCPRNTVKVLNLSRASPSAGHYPNSSNCGVLSSSRLLVSSQSKPTGTRKTALSSHGSQARLSPVNGLAVSSNFASAPKTSCISGKASGSSSHPNCVHRVNSDVPFVPSNQVHNELTSTQPVLKVEDVQSANKALVGKIHAALEFDKDKFAAFKIISADYRQDLIDTAEYLAYVHQFGLSHLVLELAKLCPDVKKQKELVEIYNYNMRSSNVNASSLNEGGSKSQKDSRKGKEKCGQKGVSPGYALADGLNGWETNIQSSHKSSMEAAEILLKDGPHSAIGKSNVSAGELASSSLSMESKTAGHSNLAAGGSKKNVGVGGGGNKPRKKVPKFLKNRLGDTSAAALADVCSFETVPNYHEENKGGNKDPPEVLPIHGVWRNGGGHRLVAMTQRARKR